MDAEVPGKFCQSCKNRNELDALICVYCGASLDKAPTDPTTTRQVETQTGLPLEIRDLFADDLAIPAHGIALFVPGDLKPIAVRTEEQFILGRVVIASLGAAVDLTDYDGYAMGVSRQHAMIRRTPDGYVLIDLQSSNGTWLDGRRIVPDRPYPLPSGTAVFLGRLKLLVLYEHPANRHP